MKYSILLLLLVLAGLFTTAVPEAEAQRRQADERSGWLGIAFKTDAEQPRTALITAVYPRSPAAEAGLREGDVVLRVNGRSATAQTLEALDLTPGDVVRLDLRREGRTREVRVTAAERPSRLAAAPAPDRPRRQSAIRTRAPRVIIINDDTIRIPLEQVAASVDSVQRQLRILMADSLAPMLRQMERQLEREMSGLRIDGDTIFMRRDADRGFAFDLDLGHRAVAGAELTPLNSDLADYFEAREGLLVLRVAPRTPAARAGLQAGDVVVRANGDRVRTVDELRRLVARAGRGEGEIELDVIRKGREREITLRWE